MAGVHNDRTDVAFLPVVPMSVNGLLSVQYLLSGSSSESLFEGEAERSKVHVNDLSKFCLSTPQS